MPDTNTPEDSSATEAIHIARTEDGHEFELAITTPTPDQEKPGLAVSALILTGMGIPASYYSPFAQALGEQGIAAARMDWRGNDTSSLSATDDFGYHQLLAQDMRCAVAALKEQFPDRGVMLFGHSLGGQLSTVYAGQFPGEIEGIVLIASGSVYFRRYGLAGWGILAGTQLARGIATVKGSFPGRQLGFGGHESVGVIRDWSRQSRTGRYQINTPDGTIKNCDPATAKANINVLAISIDGDGYAPPSAVEHLCDKLSAADIERWHYVPNEDIKDRIDHFKWARNSEDIVGAIKDWLVKNVP